MFIAIDAGGTYVRVATSDSLENVTLQKITTFLSSGMFEEDLKKIIISIKNASLRIDGIGISIIGRFDENQTIIYVHNLPGWKNHSLVKSLSEEFHCPVVMNNDAVVSALGEATYGAGKNEDFIYISWGTGIGGATVEQKNHQQITKLNWHEFFEKWEEDCGGNKIKEKYGKSGKELSEEEWNEVMENFTKHLDIFIGKLHPKKIVFGGGISIKQSQRLLVLQTHFPETKLVISQLGEDTGLFGGFALLKNAL